MSKSLVDGKGTFVDDIGLPNMAYAAFVRSVYPHALIKKVSLEKVMNLPGVLLALDAESIRTRTRAVPAPIHSPRVKFLREQRFDYSYLANKKVRYVGEPVAVVVAEDEYVAEDALESIDVEYECLQPVSNPEKAVNDSSTRLFDDWPDNVYVHAKFSGGDFEAASKEADVLLSDRIKIHRQAPSPMETRGVIAQFEITSGQLVFYSSSQNVYELRLLLAYALRMHPSSVRVIAPNVGGGFGSKTHLFPEYVVTGLCSKLLSRPVKWIETRREHLLSCQAREQAHYIELAARRNGEILGVKDRVILDLGGAILNGHGGLYSGIVTIYTMPGPYRIRNYEAELLAVVTNKAPYVAYRGYGQPEGVFAIERMIDKLAKELKMDPAEIRLKNTIAADDFPYVTASGALYDAGSFRESLEKGLEMVSYPDFKKFQEASRRQGKYVGLGIGCYVKSGASPTKILLPVDDPLVESGEFPSNVVSRDGAKVDVDASGNVRVCVAASAIGTNVDEVYREIASRELGIAPNKIQVVLGDTGVCPEYCGVHASRSTMIGGAAVAEACRGIRGKILSAAQEILDASASSIRMIDGMLEVKDGSKRIGVEQVLSQIKQPLEGLGYYERPSLKLKDGTVAGVGGIYSNGTDIAIVEVDPESLEIKILKYVAVHDAGPLLHPQIVDGQIIGGVAQGLSGCLQEEISYDPDGQLLTSTMMDYRLLSSMNAPIVETHHLETPSLVSIYGCRPVGESGTAAAAAAVAGAIEDALSPFSIRITESTLNPESLFRLIKQA